MVELEKRFCSMCVKPEVNVVSEMERQKWWQIISTQYSKPYRHYHSLSHLEDLFSKLDQISALIQKPQIVELAIFFHDLIYEPESKTNEQDSAQWFVNFAKECTTMKPEDISLVERYILQTANHLSCNEQHGHDLLYFLDLDLSILGSHSTDQYSKYAQGVRQEYSVLSDEQFCAGRSQFLKKMLAVENLFYTSHFRISIGEKAKENMQRELHELIQQKGNG